MQVIDQKNIINCPLNFVDRLVMRHINRIKSTKSLLWVQSTFPRHRKVNPVTSLKATSVPIVHEAGLG